MLEIIALFFGTRELARMATAKGQPSLWAGLFPLFWLGGEFSGAIVGAALGVEEVLMLLIPMLFCAACGGAVAFGIVNALPNRAEPEEDEQPFAATGGTRRSSGEPLDIWSPPER